MTELTDADFLRIYGESKDSNDFARAIIAADRAQRYAEIKAIDQAWAELKEAQMQWVNAMSAQAQPERKPSQAESDVLAERQRQLEKEGWSPSRDDVIHARGGLAAAAACYAMNAAAIAGTPPPSLDTISDFWPWHQDWMKFTTPRRDLVKAGALILAEIDRLDRAQKDAP